MPPPLLRQAHAIPAGHVNILQLPGDLGGIASLHLDDDATSLPAILAATPHNSSLPYLIRKLAAEAQRHLSTRPTLARQLDLLATRLENKRSPLL